jgi:hypothetical protein
MVELCLLLEADISGRLLYAEHVSEELYPEGLALTFLVSPTLPSFGERRGSRTLLFLGFHDFPYLAAVLTWRVPVLAKR